MKLSEAMASAHDLQPYQREIIYDLVSVWHKNYSKNVLRDRYYEGKISVKDLGVSVSRELRNKLNPKIDWAAKCVNWWADRVKFDGYVCQDQDVQDLLMRVSRLNNLHNLMRKVVMSSLRHAVSFLVVTEGDKRRGEPDVVISGYPATAASALWSESKERIEAGLVIVDSVYNRQTRKREPSMAYVLTDDEIITLIQIDGDWYSETKRHRMGRVPMVEVVYHPTLTKPFGSSRINDTVMSYVDDAQRALFYMAISIAFCAAPQKYFFGADAGTAKKVAMQPYGAFIGSIFIATENKNGHTPTFGQLPQLSMQPHVDYMRMLASGFSGATGVPLSSLGIVHDNPSSSEAIQASKEDAIVDINSYISGCTQALTDVAAMVYAISNPGMNYFEARTSIEVSPEFASASYPSIASMSDAITKQMMTFEWMKESDIPLRMLGYEGAQLQQLISDRSKFNARRRMLALEASHAQQEKA